MEGLSRLVEVMTGLRSVSLRTMLRAGKESRERESS